MKPKVHNHFPMLLPGDSIAAEGVGFFSHLIRMFERDVPDPWKSGKPTISHKAPVFDDMMVMEEVGRMRCAPLAEYTHTRVEIYRYHGYDPEKRAVFKEAARREWNVGYNWFALLLFAIAAATHSYDIFRKLHIITKTKVCSQSEAWLFQKSNGRRMIPELMWTEVSPQVSRDYQAAHPEEWELVYRTP